MNRNNAGKLFPRGLFQPAGSFRFSMDALLLGAFAVSCRPAWRRLIDLGCGCGAAAFCAFQLNRGLCPRPKGRWPFGNSAVKGLGVDVQENLVRAARHNAALLGLKGIFGAERLDLRRIKPEMPLLQGFDLAIANPPYRIPGQGRPSATPGRQRALSGGGGILRAFIRAARLALRPLTGEKFICLIFPLARQQELSLALEQEFFQAVRFLPVQSRPNRSANLALWAARPLPAGTLPSPASALVPEAPLLLYRQDMGPELTPEALAFCPYLAPRMAPGDEPFRSNAFCVLPGQRVFVPVQKVLP